MSKLWRLLFIAGVLSGMQLNAKTVNQKKVGNSGVNVFASMEKVNPGEKIILKGKVFYSKPLRFDYDKDGVKNSVMMAAKFFIKKMKDGEYDGYIQRYLYDIDKKKPIRWYSKKNMLQEPPISLDATIKNVKQNGKTVTFDSGPWHFTMTDGGEGFVSDEIIVNDKIRTKKVEMFGGDIEVFLP